MKYAVIQTGGKQYKVHEGDIIDIERLSQAGSNGEVIFKDVLLVADGETVKVGSPTLVGIMVKGILIENVKGEKIRVQKYKAKVRFRRIAGHRQSLSRVVIQSITPASSLKTSPQTERPVSTQKRSTRKKTV